LNGSSRGRTIDRSALRRNAKKILGVLGRVDAELSVTLVSDAEIAEIAGRFGRAARPTDVLAFPTREGPGAEHCGDVIGDVVLSVDTADRQAVERAVSLDRELGELLAHGVLHLLGMDHEREADAREMRVLEAHLRCTLELLD